MGSALGSSGPSPAPPSSLEGGPSEPPQGGKGLAPRGEGVAPRRTCPAAMSSISRASSIGITRIPASRAAPVRRNTPGVGGRARGTDT